MLKYYISTLRKGRAEDQEIVDRDLPKRVIAFTSPALLKQLSKNLKTSVDGTFKGSIQNKISLLIIKICLNTLS